jgi:hypothetical protein
MSKADMLLKKATFFERMALYADRKSFLQSVAQGQVMTLPVQEIKSDPNEVNRMLVNQALQIMQQAGVDEATTAPLGNAILFNKWDVPAIQRAIQNATMTKMSPLTYSAQIKQLQDISRRIKAPTPDKVASFLVRAQTDPSASVDPSLKFKSQIDKLFREAYAILAGTDQSPYPLQQAWQKSPPDLLGLISAIDSAQFKLSPLTYSQQAEKLKHIVGQLRAYQQTGDPGLPPEGGAQAKKPSPTQSQWVDQLIGTLNMLIRKTPQSNDPSDPKREAMAAQIDRNVMGELLRIYKSLDGAGGDNPYASDEQNRIANKIMAAARAFGAAFPQQMVSARNYAQLVQM